MKGLLGLVLMILGMICLSSPAGAQGIKIPKIFKPKVESTPAPDATSPPTAAPERSNQSTSAGGSTAPRSGGPYVVKPVPPAEPQLLMDTMEVGIEHWDYYWKVPNDNHNTSWVPRLNAKVFYGGSTKLRLKAEYTMPDGTPWFTDALEFRGDFDARSGVSSVNSPSDSDRDKKAIVTGGVFGLRITNIRDNSVLFNGKFTVVRYKPKYSDARYKNEVDYYTDYDWKLPMAIADLDWEEDHATPTIRMWFKGDLKTDSFEAQLYKDGKMIATTDDGGNVNTGERYYADKRGDDQSLFWHEFTFSWPNRVEFIRTEELRNFTSYQNAKFINQMPGDYVVKVSYNGEPVRETHFTIGNNGDYLDTGIAKKSGISTNKIFLPVKVMGTVDKWNPINAKTMGFYGVPVVGIQ